ncbi:MAG TPA: hypothetical protein VN704_10415 [Verrucomicrobiae bacterium]|nr:hypothetical protein [Verrucomicrobiae bacterium]
MNKNQKQTLTVLSIAAFALVALALTPIIQSLENASAVVVVGHKNFHHPFHHPFNHKHCHKVWIHHHWRIICHRR